MSAIYFVIRCVAFSFLWIGKAFKFWYWDLLYNLEDEHLHNKYWEQRILTCILIVLVFTVNVFWMPVAFFFLTHNWWFMLVMLIPVAVFSIMESLLIYDAYEESSDVVRVENLKWHPENELREAKKIRAEKEKEAALSKMYIEPDPSQMKRKIKL